LNVHCENLNVQFKMFDVVPCSFVQCSILMFKDQCFNGQCSMFDFVQWLRFNAQCSMFDVQ